MAIIRTNIGGKNSEKELAASPKFFKRSRHKGCYFSSGCIAFSRVEPKTNSDFALRKFDGKKRNQKTKPIDRIRQVLLRRAS